MKYFGLALCITGALITAAGVVGYFTDHLGFGIAGFVLGLGFGAIGVMAFMTNFFLQLFKRNATLVIKLIWLGLRLEVRGEMGIFDKYDGTQNSRSQNVDASLRPSPTYVEVNT